MERSTFVSTFNQIAATGEGYDTPGPIQALIENEGFAVT
jgi:hypothetical protein